MEVKSIQQLHFLVDLLKHTSEGIKMGESSRKKKTTVTAVVFDAERLEYELVSIAYHGDMKSTTEDINTHVLKLGMKDPFIVCVLSGYCLIHPDYVKLVADKHPS